MLAGASGLQQVQMPGAPNQQQPLLSGVQMAQAGQPGKVTWTDCTGVWNELDHLSLLHLHPPLRPGDLPPLCCHPETVQSSAAVPEHDEGP